MASVSSPSCLSSSECTSVDNSQRKRVCKACDRCRLKKSKCDGTNPCTRCKADNTICVFGQRKKAQDKVYPKGYVEMLERQQTQLVAGLQEMYKRMQNGHGWLGPPLDEAAGHPLTHDILDRLGVLRSSEDSTPDATEGVGLMHTQVPGKELNYMQTHNFMDFESNWRRSSPCKSNFNAPLPQQSVSFSFDGLPPTPSDSSIFSSPSQHENAFNDSFTLEGFGPVPPAQTAFAAQPRVPRPLKRKPNLSLPALSSLQTQRSMDPAQLQRQSWHAPSNNYELSCWDFFHHQGSAAICEAPTMLGLQLPTPVSASAPMNMVDWQEPVEVDFSAFINQGVA